MRNKLKTIKKIAFGDDLLSPVIGDFRSPSRFDLALAMALAIRGQIIALWLIRSQTLPCPVCVLRTGRRQAGTARWLVALAIRSQTTARWLVRSKSGGGLGNNILYFPML